MDPYAARAGGNFRDFSRSDLIEFFVDIIPLGSLSPTNRLLCMVTAIALHCLFFSPRMKRKENKKNKTVFVFVAKEAYVVAVGVYISSGQ